MFDKNRFLHINGELANILDVIADAFEIFRDEKKPRQPRGFRRVLRHRFHQFVHKTVVNLILPLTKM